MTDQIEPQENRRYIDQSLTANNQVEQNVPVDQDAVPAQRFVAPAESFGSFGPLSGYPTGTPYNGPPPFSAPFAPTNAPQAAPGYPYAPAMSGTLPYPPQGFYPPYQAPAKPKKPMRFPLTRRAPVLLQIFGMLLYSLIMALSIMGCLLVLLRFYVNNASIYTNPDGSTNALPVLIICVLLFVLVPACSLFCGIFFGGWRGFIASVLAIVGGILIAHVTDNRFGNPSVLFQDCLLGASLPVTALVVGLVYDRRKYAAWWKSMFTMFLGMAVLILWVSVFLYVSIASSDSTAIAAANAHTTQQNELILIALILSFVALLSITLLGLLYASVEGILHSIIAHTSKANQPGAQDTARALQPGR